MFCGVQNSMNLRKLKFLREKTNQGLHELCKIFNESTENQPRYEFSNLLLQMDESNPQTKVPKQIISQYLKRIKIEFTNHEHAELSLN